mmetsp:Transcript_5635/g.14082  ORF Transcript_5635/g.14082 Transcript_5635/m.14082 type:complete len:127 (+) Transcript_5635:131-511(+)
MVLSRKMLAAFLTTCVLMVLPPVDSISKMSIDRDDESQRNNNPVFFAPVDGSGRIHMTATSVFGIRQARQLKRQKSSKKMRIKKKKKPKRGEVNWPTAVAPLQAPTPASTTESSLPSPSTCVVVEE